MTPIDRRAMLTGAGMAGFAAALPGDVFAQAMDASKGGNAIPEVVNTGAPTDPRPKHHIRFAVIGLDHNHIYAMTAAVIRGGGGGHPLLEEGSRQRILAVVEMLHS